MKNAVLLSIFILSAPAALAQDLEVPRITSVTVDTAGRPVIKWQMASPSLVDGYIIKRLIVDGEGVISGTWNNVAIVEGNSVFQYADTSQAYGTMARPLERQEHYRISSFSRQGGRTYYSLMSGEASTITISGRYDQCSGTFKIACGGTGSQAEYLLRLPGGSVLQSGSSPSFSVKPDGGSGTLCASAECRIAGNTVCGSPFITIEAQGRKPPSAISIGAICQDSPAGLRLSLSLSQSPDMERAVLCRTGLGLAADTLEIPPAPLSDYAFCDPDADPQRLWTYKIAALDGCGQVLAESPVASNILLSVQQRASGNLLEWNEPAYAQDGAETYISCISGAGQERLQPGSGEFLHDIDSYAAQGAAGDFCYQVICQRGNICLASSNIACIAREPEVLVPNALNPFSENAGNQTFRPLAEFVSDYCLTVFDKRGTPLFQSRDISVGWDGRAGSSRTLCPRDSYVYVISYKSAAGRRFEKRGFVNLVY